MKKIETVWIDGFTYTKREYKKYFPQGHGNKTAIYGSAYRETIGDKLRRILPEFVRAVLILVCLVALGFCLYWMYTGM